MTRKFNINTKRLAVAALVALVANAIIFLIGTSLSATWQVGLPFAVNIVMVCFATAFPMLIGGMIVRLISKWKQGVVAFSSWAVLIFSVAGSPSGYIASQNIPTGIGLGAMHLVVGMAWFIAVRDSKEG